MINELIRIVEDLRKVVKQQNLNVSDDNLFTNACQFLRGEYASQNRPQKFNWKEQPKEDKKASEKQIAYIQSLADRQNKDITISKDMTSLEAKKIIEELLDGDSRKSN